MNILLTGCSGLVGAAITTYFFSEGHSLSCLQRTGNENGKIWNTEALEETHFDAVVHLAGENIATKRWNEDKKKRIYDSRVEGTRELVEYLHTLDKLPETFISASAIGYYGNRGDTVLSETSSKGEGFLSDLCRDWEAQSQVLTQKDVRVVHTRFGMVCSPHGGALGLMIPIFKKGLGGKLGSGNQYVSWVSIRDLVKIMNFTLTADALEGAVNVVAPNAVTNKELTKVLGHVLDRPTIFPLPGFMAKLLLGEMAEELLLSSARVVPEKLLKAGYSFQDADLKATLRYCTE